MVSMHLTGLPARVLNHERDIEDREEFWTHLVNADAENFLLHASTPSHKEGDTKLICGLSQGHMYSLLDVHTVTNDEDEEIRLLKLRNPWGRTEWDGAWGDSSDLWTDSLKDQAGFVDNDDGVFFMCLDDFLEKFETTSLCMNWPREWEPLSEQARTFSGTPNAYFELTFLEDLDCSEELFSVMACQQGPRLENFRKKKNPFKPSEFMLTLVNKDSGEQLAIKTETDYKRLFYFTLPKDIIIKAGTYVLCVNSVWDETTHANDAYKTSLVKVLCPRDLRLTEIDEAEGQDIWDNCKLTGDGFAVQEFGKYSTDGFMDKEQFDKCFAASYPDMKKDRLLKLW